MEIYWMNSSKKGTKEINDKLKTVYLNKDYVNHTAIVLTSLDKGEVAKIKGIDLDASMKKRLMALLFGAIRKEFALVFLMTTLNGNPLSYLSLNQIIVFTLITLFYIPCIATLTTLVRELRLNRTLIIVGINLLIAIIIGFSANVVLPLIG
ncbi:MAG: hypothetical protein ACUVWK_02755 [Nitrososphaerales archaeon]